MRSKYSYENFKLYTHYDYLDGLERHRAEKALCPGQPYKNQLCLPSFYLFFFLLLIIHRQKQPYHIFLFSISNATQTHFLLSTQQERCIPDNLITMDFLSELESMASLAIQQPDIELSPADEDIKRWQVLFGYSHFEATQKLQEHRSSFSRLTVSDIHWDMVREEKQAEGHDKESYEHSCSLSKLERPRLILGSSQSAKRTKTSSTFLLKLEGPLAHYDMDIIKTAAGLSAAPRKLPGVDGTGQAADFCKINATDLDQILAFACRIDQSFKPVIIPYSVADKDLSPISAYPTLGINTTLPQHRAKDHQDEILAPGQDEYPVWYFFYGTLADPAVLQRLLGEEPTYRPATIRGGILTTWGGKYKALVDAPAGDGNVIEGTAFLVKTRDHEDALRSYETNKYEVVRCSINFDSNGWVVRGLTFRFVRST